MFGIVVIHLKQCLCPLVQVRAVAILENGEVAMAVCWRRPDRLHLTSIHAAFSKDTSPVLIAYRAGIRLSFDNRLQDSNFAGPCISMLPDIEVEAGKFQILHAIDSIDRQKM